MFANQYTSFYISEDMKENKAINVKENDKVEKLPKIKDKLTLGVCFPCNNLKNPDSCLH